MSEASKTSIHALVRAIILFGFTLYILYLNEQGTLNYYIAPRMELYVKLAGMALYALSIQQALHAYRSWKHRTVDQSCSSCSSAPQGTWWKHTGIYMFFLFPLALGLFTPDTALGSQLIERKGMNFAASSNLQSSAPKPNSAVLQDEADYQQPQTQPQQPEVPTTSGTVTDNTFQASDGSSSNDRDDHASSGDDTAASSMEQPDNQLIDDLTVSEGSLTEEELALLFPEDNALFAGYAKYARTVYNDEIIEVPEHSYTEVLTTLDLYKHTFAGKSIRISGFVYKPDELESDQFAISRYAMQCCSADAAPYGVLSSYPRASSLEEDSWIEVTGTIQTTTMNETEVLAIEVLKVRSIEAPDDPYVYPNFDFGL